MGRRSTTDWEQRIATQVRELRLSAGVDQRALAERANVSLGTIQNLEAARGSSLRTLIRVVRALDRADWLDELNPGLGDGPSPIEQLRAARATPAGPRRVRRAGT
ncbi:hypothetical protein BH11ACT4_BH11ACT4_18220 [soil metagenome]